MANTRSKRPAAKPVSKPIEEPVVEQLGSSTIGSTIGSINVEPKLEPEPIFKPVMVSVKALGWYNNGNLIDDPWLPGEVRKITLDLYKRLKNDLPGNWETV